MTPSWFFLSTLNYEARSTTHQKAIHLNAHDCNVCCLCGIKPSFEDNIAELD